jgi:hypothetical protein
MFRRSELNTSVSKTSVSKTARRIRTIIAVGVLAVGSGLTFHAPAASADSTGCDRVVQISIACVSVVVNDKDPVADTTPTTTTVAVKDGEIELGEPQA